MTIAKRILSVVLALLNALFLLMSDWNEGPPKPDYLEPVSVTSYTLMDVVLRAQGMANDGENFYFSGNFGLIKTDLDVLTVQKANYLAIPPKLLVVGCKHIGGITYYDGKIYAPIEDSKVFENLYICTYDAKTLKFIAAYPLPLEKHENGVPWCVADPDKGYIYSARRDHITSINVYDATTMEFVKTIELNAPVHKVQGGDMYRGVLYLSISRDDQAVFAIKLETGEVQKAFARNLADGAEGEGMTILPTPDGALFHVQDLAKDFLAGHVRHYAFDVDSIDWQLPS
ncbi:MAG TPA: hypothetical protein VFD23_04680 [Clostridia bacterium]|nr:hypothetical protein [Clostridia bacterium]